jgi:MSHA biogenesis protein MshJ
MSALSMTVKRYHQLKKKVDMLPISGRSSILAGILIFIFSFWYLFFQAPRVATQENTLNKINTAAAEAKSLISELKGVTQKLSGGSIKAERKALNEKSKELEASLVAAAGKVVQTEAITGMLQRTVTAYPDLHLLSLKVAPKKMLVDTRIRSQKTQLYEQPITLNLRGDYFSTLGFLLDAEKIPLHFYWDEMTYRVTEYPQAEISIKIHTLGN